MTSPFIHLHVHSEYSLYDSVVRIKPLIACAKDNAMPAVALTDMANMFAVIKFYRAAVAAGIKPIIGSDVWIENSADHNKPFRLLLLCQDTEGYRNLSRLLTRAYAEGQHSGRPCISRNWLEKFSNGLIALSGAQQGDVGQALLSQNTVLAGELLVGYQQLFGDRFYIELQRTGQPYQDEYIKSAVDLAAEKSIPVVATNHVHFLNTDEFEAHEVRVCIQDGRVLNDTRRPKRFTEQQYFRSTDEMSEVFADIPEALANTLEIARRCNLQFNFGEYFLPHFPVPDGVTVDGHLQAEAERGLVKRLTAITASGESVDAAVYDNRLKRELDVIIEMGFPGYFLIVADFIEWARQNDVPVGPGRGSGAGSLAAYSLGITDLDPIKYELLFERFLNPERVSMPDFDIDFCMEKRDQVIEYVAKRYGHDKVSQI
ncbi:MAG: DNA polymerase III subunit alpha, partial [Acidiferrobacterales bacterium]